MLKETRKMNALERYGAISRRGFLGTAAALSAGVGLSGFCLGALAQTAAHSRYSGAIAVPLYTQLPDNIPFIIGFAKGFFEQRGLALQPMNLTTGPDVIRQVATQTHLGCSSPVSGMVAFGNGYSGIRIVGGCLNAPSVAYLVKPDSPIREISQLKGKNIGVNAPTSITTYLGQLMLKEAGLDPKKDANLINVKGVADSATALANNVVDCAWSAAPLSLQLVAQGKARILYDATEKHPTFTQSALFSDAAFIEQHPDVVQRWVDAVAASQAYVRAHPEDAANIWAKALNIDPKLARQTVDRLMPGFTIRLTDDGFSQNMTSAVAMGLVPKPFARAQIVDDRFAAAVRGA
jgi:NitT/TauT family transport system substrate-binding protein